MNTVSGAQRCLAVAEDVPGQADVRREVVSVRLIKGAAHGRSGEIQRGIGEQRIDHVALYDGHQLERIALGEDGEIFVPQPESQRQTRQDLPGVVEVAGVIVEAVMPQEWRAGDKAGGSAGNIKSLAVTIHQSR